jgi:hypothetical protein
VVLVENTSEDKPLPNAYVKNENEDLTFLIIIEEDSTEPTSQVIGENAQLSDDLDAHTTTTEAKNIAFSPLLVKAINCQHKSHDPLLCPI